MASTSGSLSFQSSPCATIVLEAYQRAGITISKITDEQITSALRSMNFCLQSWPNNGLRLWPIQAGMIGLNAGQVSYLLPPGSSDTLEVNVRTSTRNLGGTPFSSAGGIAANAFDSSITTACTQTAANGYISYDWGAGLYAISAVGVISFTTQTYNLVFEYSLDNISWVQVGNSLSMQFPAHEAKWFVVRIPTTANLFRIRETGNSTLNIQQIYFNSNPQDRVITRASRSEYQSYPNKFTQGTVSTFWVDKQINPVINVYPAPGSLVTSSYSTLYFTYIKQLEDAGTLLNLPPVPALFLEALTADVAHRLAIKKDSTPGESFDINRVTYLEGQATKQFNLAKLENSERVPLRISGDFSSGWARA